jgi:hypothetical protein
MIRYIVQFNFLLSCVSREITHYVEVPDFVGGLNAPSATGCRISILRLFESRVDFLGGGSTSKT